MADVVTGLDGTGLGGMGLDGTGRTGKHKSGRIPSHIASKKLSIGSFGSKLRRASFEGIGMRFYEILQ